VKLEYNLNTKYGSFFSFTWEKTHKQISIMIDGRYFTVYKAMRINQWVFDKWHNSWRKARMPISTHPDKVLERLNHDRKT